MFTSLNTSNATVGATNTAPARAAGSENSDMFTKLLVAQIQNQDPLAPTDPSQFVNQLSQLSQTEALQKLAQVNTASASTLQSLQVLALGAQVGSEVMVSASSVRLDASTVSGNVTLGGASAATTLVLTGTDGQAHELSLGAHGAGSQPFQIDPVALGLAPGAYTLQAKTGDGVAAPVELAGRIERVRMSADGGATLQLTGIGEIVPSQITSFNGKRSTNV
jgi:flagellar basal-body rod modification protein FlgD